MMRRWSCCPANPSSAHTFHWFSYLEGEILGPFFFILIFRFYFVGSSIWVKVKWLNEGRKWKSKRAKTGEENLNPYWNREIVVQMAAAQWRDNTVWKNQKNNQIPILFMFHR
jgi:uncharacterized membrane protein